MKYNYVIFGSAKDFHKLPFSELFYRDDVIYLENKIDTKNRLLNFLCRVHFNGRINKIIPLPFKGIWKRLAFRGSFKDDKPICFIFFIREIWCNKNFFAYLRKKYPGCKIVIYSQDLIKKIPQKKVSDAFNYCDLKIVYDKGDGEKYNAEVFPAVYSLVPIEDKNEIYDVCLLIKAKDRLKKAAALYDRLKELGLKCFFYVTDAPKKDRIYREGIIYGDVMPYKDTLKIVAKSKAVAEILQGDSKSYTFRPCEAIFYGKKLLTDDSLVKEEFYYSPENVLYYDSPEEIGKEFFTTPAKWDEGLKEKFSPLRLLELIEEKL